MLKSESEKYRYEMLTYVQTVQVNKNMDHEFIRLVAQILRESEVHLMENM